MIGRSPRLRRTTALPAATTRPVAAGALAVASAGLAPAVLALSLLVSTPGAGAVTAGPTAGPEAEAAPAATQPAATQDTASQPAGSPPFATPAPTAATGATAGTEPLPGRSTVPPQEPTTGPTATATTPGRPGEPSVEPSPEASADDRGRLTTTPALRRSTIPLTSVVLALVVLLVGGLLVRTALRRADDGPDDAGPVGTSSERTHPGRAEPPAADPATTGQAADPATLDFLMALGGALVDSGDAIGHVQETLEEVAAVNGVHGVGIIVLPTALVVSLPHGEGMQTQVASPGTEPLRLDQVDAVFRVVAAARAGRLTPSDGRVALAQVRASPPPFSAGLQLLGYVLFTLGLVLILRGGWLELGVGAVVGVLVGALHLASERMHRSYQPFLPVVAALGASVVVLTAARLLPELAVFPPLVACLVAFLPGALLTTAVVELSTGQIVSGSGRLAAGVLRLVLLALGILAGAQLVGVPGAAIDAPAAGAVTVLATWTGVAVFGLGVVLFKSARWATLPWVLLVLYVAYAGQVVGGLLFGSTLSAFFGALVMTPVAIVAARRPTGPPALVGFLPGFWLLVPGAVGLEGVTQFLDENTAAGVASLVTMGTSMVGIALGVLLGLVLGGRAAALAGRRGTAW